MRKLVDDYELQAHREGAESSPVTVLVPQPDKEPMHVAAVAVLPMIFLLPVLERTCLTAPGAWCWHRSENAARRAKLSLLSSTMLIPSPR